MKKLLFFSLVSCVLTLASCSDYGKKVTVSDRTEVYIKEKATEDEAKHMGNYLDSLSPDATNKKAFQLSKNDNGYTIKMAINEKEVNADPHMDQNFMALRYLIATQVFPGSQVKMIITNNKFEDIKTVKDTTFTE